MSKHGCGLFSRAEKPLQLKVHELYSVYMHDLGKVNVTLDSETGLEACDYDSSDPFGNPGLALEVKRFGRHNIPALLENPILRIFSTIPMLLHQRRCLEF